MTIPLTPMQPEPAQQQMIAPKPLSDETRANIEKVQSLMAGLNKGLKNPVVGKVPELYASRPDLEFIPTGIMSVDGILGGGFAKQRLYELYGPEGSGKTTLGFKALANNQMAGSVSVMIDAEQAFDALRAASLNVDLDSLFLSQPDYGEQAIDIAIELIRSGVVGCLLIDSVAALVPKSEYEGTMETSQQMGHIAAMMSKAMRQIKAACRQGNTCVIMINQLREKPGVVYGNPEYTPGGRAVKFFADARVEIRRKELIKIDSNVIGQNVRVMAVKNKLAPPMVPALAKLYFDSRGFDELASVVETAMMQGVLQKSGAWINIPLDSEVFPEMAGSNIGQGVENARQYLNDNPEFRQKLISLCSGNMVLRRKQIIDNMAQSVRIGTLEAISEETEEAGSKKSGKKPAKKKSS